jgi:ABC-type bacteriocin/lantibiotic exporter with double-glycine peptidase domain
MKSFTIIKQRFNDGCIPACAASILRYHGVPKPDWSEVGLMAIYAKPASTGFDQLKQFLDAQPELAEWTVIIDPINGEDADLQGTLEQFGPALIVWNQGANNSAHCVVIIEPDSEGAVVCDPSPYGKDRKRFSWSEIKAKWAGSLFYIIKK